MPEQAFSIRVASFTNAVTSGVATGKTGEHLHIDIAIKKMLDVISDKGRKGSIYLIGNGGSAAVASHIANDLANMGSLRAHVMHDRRCLHASQTLRLRADILKTNPGSYKTNRFADSDRQFGAVEKYPKRRRRMAELGGTVFITGLFRLPSGDWQFQLWIDSATMESSK